MSKLTEEIARLKKRVEDAKKSGINEGTVEGQKILANRVLDVLGLREAYPDVETTRKEQVYHHTAGVSYYGGTSYSYVIEDVTRTDYGYVRFIGDLQRAERAKDGKESLARIKAALKGAS